MRGSRKFVPLSPNFLFFVDRRCARAAHTDRTTRKLKRRFCKTSLHGQPRLKFQTRPVAATKREDSAATRL